MSFDGNINAYFVTTGTGTSNSLDSAMASLREQISEDNIRIIKASDGFPLIASGRLTKKDVFVFDRFEGDFFKQLQQTKSLIVGTPCLTACLDKCEPIPLGTSPVYTTAMRDLHISATGITPHEKERLRELIQWMGGHYYLPFGRTITHLISNTIKSNKYEHATLNGIPVMHVDWVQRVWERSSADNVSATDVEFDKYRLPIFFGTNITCTGLDTDQKNKVMRCVNDNGGTYHRAFRSASVDIVITLKNKTDSEKYKAAVRSKKDILLPEWIFDSVAKGFALPTKSYQVKSLKVSTPTKTDQSIADFTSADHTHLTDISRISVAGPMMASRPNDTVCSAVNETQDITFAAPAPVASVASGSKDLQRSVVMKSGTGVQYRLVYDEICPKAAKRAGNFLDGCCIYLSGFRMEEREKLNRILNVGGATRYDVVNEKITHIIVGKLDDAEFRTWKKDGLLTAVNIVRLDWLLSSIEMKQPASEIVHRVSMPTLREPDAPSPSSKRTLRSMNHSFKQPEKPVKKKLFQNAAMEAENEVVPSAGSPQTPLATSTELPLEEDEHHLIAQYSQENVPTTAMPPPPPPQTVTEPTQPSQLGNISRLSVQPMASSTQIMQNDISSAAPHVEKAAAVEPLPSDLTNTAMSIDYENLDFFRGMAVYIDKDYFPEEFYTQMISECEAAHGNVVASTFRDPVDYALVSFECALDERLLPVQARYIITELYVETCMKQNKLVPIEYYHKHIPHTVESKPLKEMTIVISIYTGLERDYIEALALLLGAKVNKTFARKERPLLICPGPEGSKYEGAIKWRYPVVTSEYLVHCAESGEKLSFQNYLVGLCPQDFPISPSNPDGTMTSSSKSSSKQRNPNGAENTLTRNASAPTSTAVTAEFTPLRNKRVSELAGPATAPRHVPTADTTPDSPHTPTNCYGRPSYNFVYMEEILAEIEDDAERECFADVINEMRNNQTPELERIRRQACTPVNRKVPTPRGIPECCTTPFFKKQVADEFDRRWRLPTKRIKPDTPIDVIRRRVIRNTAKAFGITLSDDEESPQPQSGGQSAQRSSRRSSLVGAAAVTISTPTTTTATTPTLHKALSNSGLVPRSIFTTVQPKTPNTSSSANTSDTFVPSTQTPPPPADTSASAHHISGLGQRASLVGKSTINFDKISFEETDVGRASTSAVAAASPEIKQITDYLKNCESRRQSLKRSANSNSKKMKSPSAPELMETEAHYVQPFESEQFGLGTEQMVGWRDPVEFGIERRTRSSPSMQHKGTPRFSISSATDEIRANIITKILKLGGQVCENLVNFDPACTHFVCERPNRGEKTLGCISSGKWVLSLKYIEECFCKDVFIDEELYEWGNCKALNLPALNQDEQVIAKASHRWRKELASDKSRGAFSGFRAILRTNERNRDALKNVIKAGQGQIIEANSPYSESNGAQLATHCFVDVKKVPLNQSDYTFLRSHGVNILTQMYINTYLMNGNEADFAKYEIHMN